MSSAQKIIQAAAGNAAGEGEYIEDLFSTYLYDGTGGDGNATQDIENGIDLDGEGGLVWIQERDDSTNSFSYLADSERGSTNYLTTQSTNAEATQADAITSFNSDGFSLGLDEFNRVNYATGSPVTGKKYASWTFRKAPKFFDVVTYTGDGTLGRAISHNLQTDVGFMMIKGTSAGNWSCWHRSKTGEYLRLNSTNASSSSEFNTVFGTNPTDTQFFVGGSSANDANNNGQVFVAYLFAHNDGDGEFGENADQDIIKCGSFSHNFNGAEVDLGFEPQWILVKAADQSVNWYIFDAMRGIVTGGLSGDGDAALFPNTSDAENVNTWGIDLTSTGFIVYGNNILSSGDAIYIAIRRGPMKTPESGTEVFAIDTRGASEPSFDSGFPVDAAIIRTVNTADNNLISSRLTGTSFLQTNRTNDESSSSSHQFDYMDGWNSNTGVSSSLYSWMFRRAPGFFDVVAYEGNGTAGHQISHNLGVAPELVLIKRRSSSGDWEGYATNLIDIYNGINLNLTNAANSTQLWSLYSTLYLTSTFIDVSVISNNPNASGSTYIAYLFATLPGVSKVGSYTGNSSTQTIDCGFTNGARFVLIKSYNDSGDWQVFDTERGIVAGDDGRLLLNRTDAESNDDYIDPHSSGFSLPNHPFTNSNAQGQKYIFLAIA